jgi:hypothetical protein
VSGTELSRQLADERRLQVNKLAFAVVAGALLMATAPVASASTPRVDRYYEVHCLDGDGNPVQAESVDAHAIEPGHKDDAILLFNRNFPFGWTCWAVGPFTP